MKNMTKNSFLWSAILISLGLSACGGGSTKNDDSGMDSDKVYKVSIQNITANQSFSPIAVVLHKSSYSVFKAGQVATVAIEKLAEAGSNSDVLADAQADAAFVASKSGSIHIAPGGSESVELSVDKDASGFKVSVVSMLVNTNDAFAGVSSNKIAALAVGESFRMHIPVWDAGTEANDELAATIPGSAGGGEGFNASRAGDVNFIAIHQGVITVADGLATSTLNESHRFNNPVASLRVERIK